ncbi:MAG: hypothetical protein J2P21_27800 [Chloracidobacterium sp.]|nr:hypothetical protein [Chloracidobacterium sp.]
MQLELRREDQKRILNPFCRVAHVSLAQAQAALETLNRQLEQAAPPPANQKLNANDASRADRSLKLHRLQGIHPEFQPMAKTATTLLAAAAASYC